MTYQEICQALSAAGVDSAEWDAQLLIEHFCKKERLWILSHPQENLVSDALDEAVSKRCARQPLQYLIGSWDFYKQTYEVSPACLIPRSDTEILVEEAIKRLPQNAFFADLCTGSGCIAISTLAERPDTHAMALELSEEALALANRNAIRNCVADRFTGVCGDVLRFSGDPDHRPHAILSNPPYIRTSVIKELSPEVKQEPHMALDGGEDGLVFYRALLKIARTWLREDGFCLFEIGYDQGEDLKALAHEHRFSCQIRKDFGGCDRVAILHPLDIT